MLVAANAQATDDECGWLIECGFTNPDSRKILWEYRERHRLVGENYHKNTPLHLLFWTLWEFQRSETESKRILRRPGTGGSTGNWCCHLARSTWNSHNLWRTRVNSLCENNPMKDRLIRWLNQFLMLDVFLVLLSFFWLAIAVVGRSIGVPLGLDLWYRLWEPVFTPAIGLLMAGALLSGLASQISKRFNSNWF